MFAFPQWFSLPKGEPEQSCVHQEAQDQQQLKKCDHCSTVAIARNLRRHVRIQHRESVNVPSESLRQATVFLFFFFLDCAFSAHQAVNVNIEADSHDDAIQGDEGLREESATNDNTSSSVGSFHS